MNDRYLFRGQRVDNGEWVVGSLLVPMGYCTTFRIVYEDLEGFACEKEVVPETVGQYTTLKDKNGKLVFENDIVNTGYGFFVIQYCDTCKQYQLFDGECFACLGDFHWYEFIDELATVEVIGNIHQNRELLEKGGK